MSESTLQTTFTDIETEIARFLGYFTGDRDLANRTATQVLDSTACITRGLRQFYFPTRTPSQLAVGEQAHRWSFLRPRATLDIWDDVIAADAITVSTAVFATPVTTVTASGSVFYPSMEELSMGFDENSNTFVIDEYVSATQVKVTGDASGEVGNTITIDSGDLFTLPWDFGGIEGPNRFAYDVNENKLAYIDVTSDVRIDHLRQGTVSSGTPYLAAIVPLSTDGTQGQRRAVIFHPPPNDVITLHYRYYLLPDALVDTSAEYPYGSVEHSETILESCLAIAEVREKDSSSTVHQDRFKELLQASIDGDRRHGDQVQTFGYNRDGSDGAESRFNRNCHKYRHYSLVTYEGVEY